MSTVVFLHNLDRLICNIMLFKQPKYKYKVSNYFVYIGGENMASKKCDCTTRKSASTSRKSSNRNTEASTDNAKTNSRTTSKKTSRVKNCN